MSSKVPAFGLIVLLFVPATRVQVAQRKPRQQPSAASAQAPDPQEMFQQGEAALRQEVGSQQLPRSLRSRQVLQQLGRVQEARVEMENVTRMMNALRAKRQKELYDGPLPNPELTQEPR